MTEADIALWEAAERTAAAAPEILPGDDVALRLKQLYSGLPAFITAMRSRRIPAASRHRAA